MNPLPDDARVLLVGARQLIDGLAAAAPDATLVAADDPSALAPDALDADVVVAAWPAAAPALDALRAESAPPVVWCVPRETSQADLRVLTEAREGQVLFEPCAPGDVLEAARTLLARRAAAAPSAGPADPMAALWERFRGTMLERQAVLEAVGAELLEGTATADRIQEAHAAAHKLHGALGTYGLMRGSELAASIEEILEGRLDPGARFRMSELIIALRREITRGRAAVADGEPDATSRPGRPTLLIVESSQQTADELMAAAAGDGWQPVHASTVGGALAAVAQVRPQLVILDPEGAPPAELESLLKDLALGEPLVPVVFHTGNTRLSDRLRAVSLGARAFVQKPASPEAVLGRASLLVEDEGGEDETILAVDDDPTTLHLISAILRGSGYRVRTLEDAREFWQTLEAVQPDLLILDVEMPHVNGFQLCRVVRADPRWTALPVLFLTARGDQEALIRGFQAGADDFLRKPVVPPEMTARVDNLMDRLRLRRRLRAVDTETGLTSRAGAMERLEVMLALAHRYDEVVTCAVVRLAGEDDEVTRAAMDRLSGALYKDLRGEDVLAAWSGTELMVARYAVPAADMRPWLARLTETSPEGVELAVGLAEFPTVQEPGALVQAAMDHIRAGRRGRDRLAGPGGTAEPEREEMEADIVIVEDDESLGALLVGTLEERGFSTRWIRDGLDAERALTGPTPAVHADVIILDVGLPGLDGLTLLRRLNRDGITRRSRVLMLTARSAEAEVVRALELGAFDHVPKPFSVSELVHRVRRATRKTG